MLGPGGPLLFGTRGERRNPRPEDRVVGATETLVNSYEQAALATVQGPEFSQLRLKPVLLQPTVLDSMPQFRNLCVQLLRREVRSRVSHSRYICGERCWLTSPSRNP